VASTDKYISKNNQAQKTEVPVSSFFKDAPARLCGFNARALVVWCVMRMTWLPPRDGYQRAVINSSLRAHTRAHTHTHTNSTCLRRRARMHKARFMSWGRACV